MSDIAGIAPHIRFKGTRIASNKKVDKKLDHKHPRACQSAKPEDRARVELMNKIINNLRHEGNKSFLGQ